MTRLSRHCIILLDLGLHLSDYVAHIFWSNRFKLIRIHFFQIRAYRRLRIVLNSSTTESGHLAVVLFELESSLLRVCGVYCLLSLDALGLTVHLFDLLLSHERLFLKFSQDSVSDSRAELYGG